LFETPTGWKFFGNLLDQNMISICGEESFGTGSNHVREKDGLWAVLCWLSILADTQKPVEAIVREHWAKYGRNYYQRYDYEGLDNEVAAKVFARIVEQMPVFSAVEGQSAEIFSYTDPVDKSVSDNQGWIFKYADGSRFIFRKSGTGSSGTTIRLYLEKYNKAELDLDVSLALNDIIATALDVCQIYEITGLKEPTVIT
jgi:phosphoglucomutase